MLNMTSDAMPRVFARGHPINDRIRVFGREHSNRPRVFAGDPSIVALANTLARHFPYELTACRGCRAFIYRLVLHRSARRLAERSAPRYPLAALAARSREQFFSQGCTQPTLHWTGSCQGPRQGFAVPTVSLLTGELEPCHNLSP